MSPRFVSDVQPRISVVVPTCRRPHLLARCLRALVSQSIGWHAFEIIVVDDGNSDQTRSLVQAAVRRYPKGFLRCLRPQIGRGPAVARNRGWRAARGDIIAFTDDDTVPAPDWLERGERAMLQNGWNAMAGRVIVPRRSPEPPTDHELMTLGLEKTEFVTANAFVLYTVLDRVGGFDERFQRAWREDTDLQFRLEDIGVAVGHCEEAVVSHPVRPETWGVSLRQQKNVFFDALLFRKHPGRYRERVRAVPPVNYFAIVALSLTTLPLAWAGATLPAWASALVAGVLLVRLTVRRLRCTSRRPAHVVEMAVTSALIPFLSVYWRLRGAWHFRVWFL